jgi:glutamine synthetase
MTTPSFIDKHGLWTDDQKRRAEELKLFLEKDKLQFVRIAWADPHGASRAKAVTVPAFLAALKDGYNINVARFRERAHLRVVHARRRHGPR